MYNVKKVFDYKLQTTKDLVSPNKKKRVDEFVKLCKMDADISKEMGKNKSSYSLLACKITSLAKYFGRNLKDERAEKYRNLVNSKDPKDKEKAFRDFSKFLGLSPELRSKYFTRLKKQGFNSIYDDNDIYAKYANRPLLIFDPKTSLKIVGKEYISDEVMNSFWD